MAEHAPPAGDPHRAQHAEAPVVTPSEPSHRAGPAEATAAVPRARYRRVTTPAPDGSDPSPEPETPGQSGGENDEQLKRDKPPHWG